MFTSICKEFMSSQELTIVSSQELTIVSSQELTIFLRIC